jgi:DNA-binding protein WhiA
MLGGDVVGEVSVCPECAASLLRGLFVSSASITDPEKQYHLEFLFEERKIADAAFDFLCSTVGEPRVTERKSGIGLVYKGSSAIEDILSVIGANQAYFSMLNGKIEREIRNNENRATNCETRNIAMSVDAAQRQIEAIESLKAQDKYESLPQSLKETAEMRLLYPSLPLSELAQRFAPPLTKSGLNNRLKRIIELANL